MMSQKERRIDLVDELNRKWRECVREALDETRRLQDAQDEARRRRVEEPPNEKSRAR